MQATTNAAKTPIATDSAIRAGERGFFARFDGEAPARPERDEPEALRRDTCGSCLSDASSRSARAGTLAAFYVATRLFAADFRAEGRAPAPAAFGVTGRSVPKLLTLAPSCTASDSPERTPLAAPAPPAPDAAERATPAPAPSPAPPNAAPETGRADPPAREAGPSLPFFTFSFAANSAGCAARAGESFNERRVGTTSYLLPDQRFR